VQTKFGDDRAGAWRRMITIAFEDVGAADADALIETIAGCTSSEWRLQQGNERVLAYLARRLTKRVIIIIMLAEEY
jgi:replication-associated recombination protein RarA